MSLDYLKINKKLWNDRTEVHFQSDFYNVEAFIKGKNSLNKIELDLLGNIEGKSVLHLQCHFGQDTLSLARMGANVTGVDFSEKAMGKANQLKEKLNLNARFIQSDVYNLKNTLDKKFDIVFTTYGVLGWLPDMTKWAKTANHFLKPGGKLILVEFHPIVWMFSYDFKKIEYNYMDSPPIIEELEGTYTDRNAGIKNSSVCWNHGLASVISSLIKSGLRIKDFQEYDYSPYNCFENTLRLKENKFQIKGLEKKIPMVYSVVADKSK